MRERVERELSAGAPQSVVARRVGIGERTLRRWLADGRIDWPERWQVAARRLEDRYPQCWGLREAEAGILSNISAEIDELAAGWPAIGA